jgi:quinol-cytochrome oxidoreductase complex cytochrome b subunit
MAFIYAAINTAMGGLSQGIAIGSLVLYASVFIAGVQTVAYSFLMEFFVNKKTKSIHSAAFLSGLLGFFVVASAYLRVGGFNMHRFERDPYTPILGFLLGVALGYVLKYYYEKAR